MAFHASGWYRALLLAYPAEFREEYAPEMERLVASRLATESRLLLWLELIADVARTAPKEHLLILQRDLRHSTRVLAKSPAFAATAILALALGISAAVTIFSVINAVLIRDLPYGDAQRLVYLWTPLPRYASLPREMAPSFADVLAWRQSSRSFTEITGVQQKMLTLDSDGGGVRIGAGLVLGNFFETLQATPLLGRAIVPQDDDSSKERVAVISYNLWRSQFQADRSVLGRELRLNGSSFRIAGVMPEDFGYPHDTDFPVALARLKHTDVWIPAALTPKQSSNRMSGFDAAIGRLRPGVSLAQAQSEMSAIEAHLDPLNLPEMRGMESLLVPFIETSVGPVRTLMRLLAGAVILVLLIACGNVASLLMARAAGRVHEMGVRSALGAPKARLMRQLLTESLLLSTAGGVLGAAASVAILKILVRLNPGDIPRFEDTALDGRVLVFALAISVATGILFGILPAIVAARVQVSDLLRQGGRGTPGGSSRIHSSLVVANVALAVVLLVGAVLLLRSYAKVQGEDKGFAPSTLTAELVFERRPGRLSAINREIVTRVSALPGVTVMGITSVLPLSHHESTSTFRVDGYANRPNQQADLRLTAGEYFQAMQMRLVAGRFLTAADNPDQPLRVPQSVVVSEGFAKTYFPDGNALGGRVQRGTPGNQWSTIVGVVADVRHSSLEKRPQPTLYEPSWFGDNLAIQTALAPESMVSAVRQAVREVDPGISLTNVETMRQRISGSAARRRFQTVLLAAFAGIAVLLALIGLYGLLAYTVRLRSAEIGVRMTLGAGRREVVVMVVRSGLLLTAGGLAIGLAAAGGAARWLASLLYGVPVLDPLTFAGIPIFVVLAAVMASAIPAWKAARIDPMVSLRQQ
ncbi:MAG TPA: ABC transporter permease [Bryobacteraceae bacterium]|nr:ABC transporter permease [Bryobacteraceae bacterium]